MAIGDIWPNTCSPKRIFYILMQKPIKHRSCSTQSKNTKKISKSLKRFITHYLCSNFVFGLWSKSKKIRTWFLMLEENMEFAYIKFIERTKELMLLLIFMMLSAFMFIYTWYNMAVVFLISNYILCYGKIIMLMKVKVLI